MSIITHIWSAPRVGGHQRLEGRKLSVDAPAEQPHAAARIKRVFNAVLTIVVFVVVVIAIVALKSWIWIPSVR